MAAIITGPTAFRFGAYPATAAPAEAAELAALAPLLNALAALETAAVFELK